jgi:hypothetical protein
METERERPTIITMESSYEASKRAFQELKGEFADLFGGPLKYTPSLVITNSGFLNSDIVKAVYLGFPSTFEGVTSDELEFLSASSLPIEEQISIGMYHQNPTCALNYFKQTIKRNRTPIVIADSPVDCRNWAEERQKLHEAIRAGNYTGN